ncbi:hypothetical protein C4E44_06710 [Pseudomonas sp. MWU12-2312b]|nr:hypothetical protein C4E44_06710 [Pseudomonas sp. MWU12-2312b]
MLVNDNAGGLTARGVLRFIASRLAPAGERVLPKQAGIFICSFDLVGVLIRRGRCARIPRSNTARWPFIRKLS